MCDKQEKLLEPHMQINASYEFELVSLLSSYFEAYDLQRRQFTCAGT